MGDVHVLQDNADLLALGLDGKELSTFVNLLSRLINTSADAKEGQRNPPRQSLVEAAETMYRFRRRREELMTARFGNDIFADPAWDIILDLYIHNSKNMDVSVTNTCAAAMVPITTALRYITVLSDRGLVERTKNPKDGRSYLLRLSSEAIQIVEAMLAELPSQSEHSGPYPAQVAG